MYGNSASQDDLAEEKDPCLRPIPCSPEWVPGIHGVCGAILFLFPIAAALKVQLS